MSFLLVGRTKQSGQRPPGIRLEEQNSNHARGPRSRTAHHLKPLAPIALARAISLSLSLAPDERYRLRHRRISMMLVTPRSFRTPL